MSNHEKDKKNHNQVKEPEDRCGNCGATSSEQFWDYPDGSVLCDKCHDKIGDEWYDYVKEKMAKAEDEEETLSRHKEKTVRQSGAKKMMMFGAILVIVLIIAFSAKNILAGGGFASQDVSSGSGNIPSNGEVQNAKLALVDFSYKLTPNTLKVGVPVRIEVDSSTLAGCMRTVVIKDFGIRKTITANDNIIEFTPTKTGTFWITCGMGMGPGSFQVVSADGTPAPDSAANAAPPAPSGSCGAGGGGCGCGGG